MKTLTYCTSLLLVLLLTACGNGGNQSENTDNAAPATTEQPVDGAFAPANDALQSGKSAAEIGGLLMQRFAAVSDPNTGILNEKESRDFVKVATALAEKFPDDTLAAMPLYRAGEVVRALNDPQRAAQIYEQVHNNYPSYSKAPEALFMLAFTYDEDLKQYDKARETYEKFLELYPDNIFAESTPMLLENLGKSQEEMLEMLEQ